MTTLKIGSNIYEDIALLALDKDGTLIDFGQMWGKIIHRWIDDLVSAADASPAVRLSLEQTLGYDSQSRTIVPDSPLTVASLSKLRTIAMAVLYQCGTPWHTAEEIVAQQTSGIDIDPTDIQPVGNVATTLRNLHANGVQLLLITTDNRESSRQILHHMGILDLFTDLVCGDDPIPNKPAPDGILRVAEQLNITPKEVIMVGDTVNDMNCGRNAAVRACVGVTDGGGDALALQETADVTIATIDEILLA